MRQRISVRDVAHAAGVAIGSVSRVLNDSGYASPELRRRVLEAVAKLGYEPDFTARHLRTGRSKTIGYLLPNIANPSLAAHLSESPEVHGCFARQWLRFGYGTEAGERLRCLAP